MAERKPVNRKVAKQPNASYVEKSTTPEVSTTPEASVSHPRSRRSRRIAREQISTRIRTTLRDLMDDYTEDTGIGVQAITEAALTEYLKRRGYEEQA